MVKQGIPQAFRSMPQKVLSRSGSIIMLFFLPIASGEYAATAATEAGPIFTPVPLASTPPHKQQDISNDIASELGYFNVFWWTQRARMIRSGGTDVECLGNLSLALSQLSDLSAGEYNGASGALSLLPTAGALIGAPSKELWLVFKLMPLAGVLSMMLSLGGTIIPSSANDYDLRSSFTYGGMVATDWVKEKQGQTDLEGQQMVTQLKDHERFAARVERRSKDKSGGNSYTRIWIAVFVQMVLLGVIFVALWFGQAGGVIIWWCRVSNLRFLCRRVPYELIPPMQHYSIF